MKKNLFKTMHPILLLVLISAMIARISSPDWAKVMQWIVPDNDDAMRILEVRAWLHGQGFYDLLNHRLNPPNGGDIHWSRIGDLPLALVELILRPFMGELQAEKIGAFFTPLFLGGIFALTLGLVVSRFEKEPFSYYVAAFLGLSTVGAMTYFQPARVDHHGLQIISALLALWGLLSQNKKGALVAGLAIALSITIGFETVPIVAVMIIWAALVWGARGNGEFTAIFTLSLAFFVVCGFLINVAPQNYLVGQNDKLSIAQVLPILTGAGGLFLSTLLFSYTSAKMRFIALFAIGIAVILVAAQFPILLEKPYYQTSPLLHKLWLNAVTETHPLYKARPDTAITLGFFEVMASIAVAIKILILWRDKKRDAMALENWLLLGAILISLTLLAFFWQLRMAGLAQTFSVVVAAALFVTILKNQGLLNALLVLIIVNPMVPNMVSNIYNKAKPKTSNYAIGGGVSCKGVKAFSALAALPDGLVASHIDFGAQALLTTNQKVLAAPYHRNQGNMVAYSIFLAKPDEALQIIRQHGVDYLGLCTKSAETEIISRESPNGLMKQLVDKKYPDYLELVPAPTGSGIMVWKVKK